MEAAVIKMDTKKGELVDVEALGAYAKGQWDLGDRLADKAGSKFWYLGSAALEKAKPSVSVIGKESFGEYLVRVTGRPLSTCYKHQQAYREHTKLLTDARNAGSNSRLRESKIPNTIRGLTGQSKAGRKPGAHITRDWTPEVDAQAKRAFSEQVDKRIETAAQERAAEQALAKRLIDIGYKVLAKELHPDAGGNQKAMARLSEVKRRLYNAFGL